MKALMLGWEFPPHKSGGLGTACEGLVHGLSQQGVEVLMVLPRLAGGEQVAGGRALDAGQVLSAGITELSVASTLRPYPSAGAGLSGGYGPDLAQEVRRYSRAAGEIAARENFDVIHAHDWMTVDAGIEARERSGKPLVWHVHASEHDRNGSTPDGRILEIEQRGIASADRVVCVSHFTAELLRTRYGADPGKLRVVHNATRPRRSPRLRAWRAERPFAEPLALFMGRVTGQKDPGVFLEAAAQLVRAGRDIKFALAGDGDLWSRCVEQAAGMGLSRHMYFPGFLRGSDVDRMYAMADMFVMPSVSEPFGIAPLEAMSFGVPVIISRQSGVSEILDSAIRVDAGDSAALAQAIGALADDPELRAWLGGRGQEEARRLRWRLAGAKVADLYREMTG